MAYNDKQNSVLIFYFKISFQMQEFKNSEFKQLWKQILRFVGFWVQKKNGSE